VQFLIFNFQFSKEYGKQKPKLPFFCDLFSN